MSQKARGVFLISAYVFLMIVAAILVSKFVDQENLQLAIKSWGSWGVIIFFVFEVFYVTFTPLLNTAIYITAGYIFGGPLGWLVNFLATTTGLFLIVYLVRKYGRPMLKNFVSPKFYDRFDSLAQRVGPVLLLVVYLLPFTPDDELTYIIAAGPLGLKRFILPIVLGTMGKSALAYIGALGTPGITIALYARLILLIVGLIAVGIQEYVASKMDRVFS